MAPGIVMINGQAGLGPPTAVTAIEQLGERSGTQGVCLAAVRNCAHLGILAPYVERIAAKGLIGIVLTTSEALVHPWAGRERLLGTNPIAIGVPAEPHPLVVDLATSVVPMGKVLDCLERGISLQPGWAVDAAGEPTTDPAEACDGALSPFGDAKGYALGLAVEVLVALLTGTALGRDVVGTLDAERPVSKGDVMVVVDPSVLGAGEAIYRISEYLDSIRQSESRIAGQPVRIPGDGARARRTTGMRRGIDVDDTVWAEISQAANGAPTKASRARPVRA
jgi:LDH2 family malate/lactate/ureidoglycolate dehydrogenase